MAGLLLLWLGMESVCGSLKEKRVALFSDNSPTVGWVRRLATRGYIVSAHLIRALVLCLKLNGTCPITPLHIAGEENSMTDIPSRSFGSEPKWHCKSNTDLLTLFNNLFPIPSQNSWTVFQISYAVGMRVTSYRTPHSLSESASLQALQGKSVQATTVKENRSKLEVSLA